MNGGRLWIAHFFTGNKLYCTTSGKPQCVAYPTPEGGVSLNETTKFNEFVAGKKFKSKAIKSTARFKTRPARVARGVDIQALHCR